MTLEPLLNASPAIQIHVLAVVPAALIGAVMLFARKGTPVHRIAGRVWIVLMVLTALSSFFIHTIRMIGPFSPIHLLSVVTLLAAFEIVRSARQRRIQRHRRLVKSLYFGGIGIAGLFTLLPGRIMHETVFGASVAAAVEPVAQQASSPVAAIAGGAPIWVWPLLVALIALGVSRIRERDLPVWRLLLLPAILAGMSLVTALSGQIGSGGLLVLAAAGALGAFCGWISLRGLVPVRLAGGRVRVRGEVLSLIAILGIFASRFAEGAMKTVAPHLLQEPGFTELFIAVPVFLAALMAARSLAQAGFNPLARPLVRPLVRSLARSQPRLSGEAEC